MSETWKKLTFFGDIYEISTKGNIRNRLTNRVLKNKVKKNGYVEICLYHNGLSKYFLVHRLVALTFLDNPEGKKQVNHLNNNPADNRVENLAWCTPSENNLWGYKHGRMKPVTHRFGVKTGTSSQFRNVLFDKARGYWIARVENTVNGKSTTYRKSFSIKKYGNNQAELAAAYAVNEILDSLNDILRPRNPVTVNEKDGKLIYERTSTT